MNDEEIKQFNKKFDHFIMSLYVGSEILRKIKPKRQKTMNYNQYDKKPPQANERETIIINCLSKKPMEIMDIVQETGLLYHQVRSCLLRLRIKKSIVTKRKQAEKTYFGIIPKYRKTKEAKDEKI